MEEDNQELHDWYFGHENEEGVAMNPVKVVIATVDDGDWEALYVNGKLETEGHSISSSDFVELINKFKSFENIKNVYVTEEFIEDLGGFPANVEIVLDNKLNYLID